MKSIRNFRRRSSCDACGASKLRCDRGQPACGRCVTLKQNCVYGISRYKGRPPRNSIRNSSQASSVKLSTSPSPESKVNASYRADATSYPDSRGSDSSTDDGNAIASIPVSLYNGDDCTKIDLDTSDFDTIANDILFQNILDYSLGCSAGWATPPENGFGGGLSDLGISCNLSGSVSNSIHSSEESFLPVYNSLADRTLAVTAGDSCEGHDHYLLAQETFKDTIMVLKQSKRLSIDQILQINRQARDQLTALLSCHCGLSMSPTLALLYASTISYILTQYEKAACEWSSHAVAVSPYLGLASLPLTRLQLKKIALDKILACFKYWTPGQGPNIHRCTLTLKQALRTQLRVLHIFRNPAFEELRDALNLQT
ncbi:hypothetical protein LZ32DRAFT_616297 [Colletotrichum eremochloae]|nr:hypothetical protein LZ32DRAFT_616297 [Colletotrichum eremochloae]